MTKAQVKATAEAVKAFQTAQCLENLKGKLVGVDLPDDFKVDPDIDEWWAEDLMQDTKDWLAEPSRYSTEVCRLGYKVSSLRASAIGGAIRYDKDRVQGGQPYCLDDRVIDILETEEEYEHAKAWYTIILNDTKKLLDRALDKESAKVWYECMVRGYSREVAASKLGLSKRRVQWLLEKKQNIVSVLIAFSQWRDGVEYYND